MSINSQTQTTTFWQSSNSKRVKKQHKMKENEFVEVEISEKEIKMKRREEERQWNS